MPVRSRAWSGTLLALAVLLPACTQLDAVRVRDSEAMKAEGAPYNLTFTQYDFTVKRRLASCVDKAGNADMKITTTVEAVRKEARDPAHEYVIDFAQLRNIFKTTDVAVEYHENGALKSVNASVHDKTGEFLKSAFSVAAKIATLSAGAGGPAAACTEAAAKDVAEAKAAEEDLEKKSAELATKAALLERKVAVASALGRARSDNERRALSVDVDTLFALKDQVDKAQKRLGAALKKVTKTATMTWPTDGTSFTAALVPPLETKDIKDWGSVSDEGRATLQKTTGAWARIGATTPMGAQAICSNKAPTPADPPCFSPAASTGLKYRMPAPGMLQVCTNAKCEGDEAELFADAGLFSQLGPVLTLPLRSYPFMSQTVVLTFNEAGQPTKIGYKSESSVEKASDAVSTFVDEYGKVRLARKPKSALDLVKEEAELLEAKAKLASAKKALEPPASTAQADATAALKADTALLDAELAKMKAQAALDEARRQASL